MYAAWTIKYKPKSLSEIVDNREAIEKLVSWVKSWDKGAPKQHAAFLYGSPGVGKTVSVEALANDFEMEFVEKNASDYRTEEAVQRFAGLASQYGTLFGKKRLVLFDELDGITGKEDRGGVGAITAIVKTARCPIVLIANNAYDPRLTTLRFYCLLIEFKKPAVSEVLKCLRRICDIEKIRAEEAALKFIAQRSEGDLRSAVNDLQALAQGKKSLTYDDVSWLAYRDRKEAIFNVLRLIFYSKSVDAAKRAIDMADVDPDMLFEWIYENLPYHLRDAGDLAQAMDSLATADLYRGRIRMSQDWSLTRYVIDFMTAGVAMARQKTAPAGFVPLRFPERIKMLSKTRSERQMQGQIGLKIKRRCHISAKRANKDILPYLRVIFENNAKMAAGLMKWLDLDETMMEYLAGTKIQTKAILKMSRSLYVLRTS
jgi:replication factor C large subunit